MHNIQHSFSSYPQKIWSTIIPAIVLLLSINLFSQENYKVVRQFKLSFAGINRSPFYLLPYKILDRPTVGLALSGGGIRGIAQIGALSVLEQEGIPIDYLVGTSIGGVIGALDASGYSPAEIMDMARSIDWGSVLSDTPKRSSLFLNEKEKRGRAFLQFRIDDGKPVVPEAFTPGQKITKLFTELVLNACYHDSDFSQLRTPVTMVTTDMLNGRKVMLDHGDLAQAMRASIALPLLFTPVELDSAMLVDGGVVSNIPVEETHAAGADFIIALDTTSPLRQQEDLGAPWEVADQITTIMQQGPNKEQLARADLVISLADFKTISSNYDALEALYLEGVKRTRAQIETIRRMLGNLTLDDADSTINIDQIQCLGADLHYLSEVVDTARTEFRFSEIQTILNTLYMNGDLADASAALLRNRGETRLVFDLSFNPELKNVEFYGNTQMPSDSLAIEFTGLLGKTINYIHSQKAFERIIRRYRASGFSLARIDRVLYNEQDCTAHVYLSEGIIHQLAISGLQKTHRYVISRELEMQKGEFFQFERARGSLENIFATGLFEAVNLQIKSRSNLHDVSIHVAEKPSNIVRMGLRYDTERSARVFAELSDENFRGTANDLTFHLQYGGRDFKTFLNYNADRIFKTYLTSRLNLHYYKSEHFAYQDLQQTGEYVRKASGLDIDMGQQLGRYGTVSAILRLEEIDLDGISGNGYDAGSLSINTLGLKTVIDTRDDVPFPGSGKHHIFFYEVSSGLFLGADISFFKVMNQLATYTTFFEKHTFCPKIIWGTSDMTTPYSEQFRIGGLNSFYGLREGQLWGRHVMLASLEYRYRLTQLWTLPVYFSARYDLAAAWNKLGAVQANDFIGGYGGELALKTPIGPVQIAYGITRSGHGQFYLSAGFEF